MAADAVARAEAVAAEAEARRRPPGSAGSARAQLEAVRAELAVWVAMEAAAREEIGAVYAEAVEAIIRAEAAADERGRLGRGGDRGSREDGQPSGDVADGPWAVGRLGRRRGSGPVAVEAFPPAPAVPAAPPMISVPSLRRALPPDASPAGSGPRRGGSRRLRAKIGRGHGRGCSRWSCGCTPPGGRLEAAREDVLGPARCRRGASRDRSPRQRFPLAPGSESWSEPGCGVAPSSGS